MILKQRQPRPAESPEPCDLTYAEPLNAVDCAMRAVDLGLRGIGYPGFETQLVLWLTGRLDEARLRQALDRVAVAEPLIVSRLNDSPGGLSCWRRVQQH